MANGRCKQLEDHFTQGHRLDGRAEGFARKVELHGNPALASQRLGERNCIAKQRRDIHIPSCHAIVEPGELFIGAGACRRARPLIGTGLHGWRIQQAGTKLLCQHYGRAALLASQVTHAETELSGQLDLPDLLQKAILEDVVHSPSAGVGWHVAAGSKGADRVSDHLSELRSGVRSIAKAKFRDQRVGA